MLEARWYNLNGMHKKLVLINVKHQVSFEEARTVFGDQFARISADRDHSEGEQRWHIIGMSDRNRVIVVAYTERTEIVRIITDRKAEPVERRRYETIREQG